MFNRLVYTSSADRLNASTSKAAAGRCCSTLKRGMAAARMAASMSTQGA